MTESRTLGKTNTEKSEEGKKPTNEGENQWIGKKNQGLMNNTKRRHFNGIGENEYNYKKSRILLHLF
jgi:hypothetical protein